MKRLNIILVLLVFILLAGSTFSFGKWILDLENGAVFSGYNDARIPGEGGTLFSLSEQLKTESKYYYRIRAGFEFSERHHISALFAPLTLKASGTLPYAIDFAGQIYAAQTRLNATYTFNSYRLSYRYTLVKRETFQLGLGLTAKIRDAVIKISSASQSSEKKNVGPVPLINFSLLWEFASPLAFLLEGDALAAPQGRAEDVMAALVYPLSDQVNVRAGYRILEGGADNDEVYTFTLLHYALFGVCLFF